MNKFLFLVALVGVERFCHFQTDGFALAKMVNNPTPVTEPSILTLTFIGAGKQYYAFETPDHNYVVKFMKFSRRRPLPWLENLPLPGPLQPWKNRYLAERAKRLANLRASGLIASHTLVEETGIVPFSLPDVVTLIDKLGIHHTIHVDETAYIVQKKAMLLLPYLREHPHEVQSVITSYISTVSSQCRKGVCNLDPIVERNFGVADHRLIVLDFGSLLAHKKLDTSVGLKQEIFLELLPLREWLQEHFPEHLTFFDATLTKTVTEITIRA